MESFVSRRNRKNIDHFMFSRGELVGWNNFCLFLWFSFVPLYGVYHILFPIIIDKLLNYEFYFFKQNKFAWFFLNSIIFIIFWSYGWFIWKGAGLIFYNPILDEVTEVRLDETFDDLQEKIKKTAALLFLTISFILFMIDSLYFKKSFSLFSLLKIICFFFILFITIDPLFYLFQKLLGFKGRYNKQTIKVLN